jgi:hypothetical protein
MNFSVSKTDVCEAKTCAKLKKLFVSEMMFAMSKTCPNRIIFVSEMMFIAQKNSAWGRSFD